MLKKERPENYTKDELWDLVDRLPPQLKDAIFDVETAEAINQACIAAGIDDDRISDVAICVGHVLMGFVHYGDFTNYIRDRVYEEQVKRHPELLRARDASKETIGLTQEQAEVIAEEIDRLVFEPVRHLLNSLKVKRHPRS